MWLTKYAKYLQWLCQDCHDMVTDYFAVNPLFDRRWSTMGSVPCQHPCHGDFTNYNGGTP